MIAKKTGWQVLRNFKNQVYILFITFFLLFFSKPLEVLDFFDVLLDGNESGFFILGFSTDSSVFILYKSDIYRPRSTCRHVDLAKFALFVRRSVFKPLEVFDFHDVLLDRNESDFILDFSAVSTILIQYNSDIYCPRSICRHAVSYTHLTLPTTPYV